MDCFGELLEYNQKTASLETRPFKPIACSSDFPNLLVTFSGKKGLLRAIFSLREGSFNKKASETIHLPWVTFNKVNACEINIEDIETGKFLSSVKGEQKTGWQNAVENWERFSLLTKETLIGLSLSLG